MYRSVPFTLQFPVSNKFFDLSLLLYRNGGGGGSAGRKIYWTRPWKLATIPLYNLLKSPLGAHVHKTIYEPMIDTDLAVSHAFDAGKSITWASGRGLGPGISTFLHPKWHSPFHRAQKRLDFQGPIPSLPLVMDLPTSKALRSGP
jgi:hypothetical protein